MFGLLFRRVPIGSGRIDLRGACFSLKSEANSGWVMGERALVISFYSYCLVIFFTKPPSKELAKAFGHVRVNFGWGQMKPSKRGNPAHVLEFLFWVFVFLIVCG